MQDSPYHQCARAIAEDNIKECAKLFLKNRINPNEYFIGVTLFHLAVTSNKPNHHKIVKLLMKNGANPKEYAYHFSYAVPYGPKTWNALHIAAEKKCVECCNLLMQHVCQSLTPANKKCAKTLLLCLYRSNRKLVSIVRNAESLLLPHLKTIFTPNIKSLLIPFLNYTDFHGKRACDLWPAMKSLDPAFWQKEYQAQL